MLDWSSIDDAWRQQPALLTRLRTVSWSDFQEQVCRYARQAESFRGRRVGLVMAPDIESIEWLMALAQAGVHAFLIASDTSDEQLTEWSADFELATVFRTDGTQTQFPNVASVGHSAAITILTSGTTGKPKAVQHSWDSLARPVRRIDPQHDDAHPRWLLTFRPHLYAGLQVIMQCLMNHGTLVMCSASDDADNVALLAELARVEFASATPSYWRWLLTLARNETLSNIPLKQITLGGEVVDQPTLDALKNLFPTTRLVHIYATTELGRCFSVSDGMAGFPTRYLDRVSTDGVEMRIEEGELVVRSANAMSGYDQATAEATTSTSPQNDWFHTGDLVNMDGDRICFAGRKTDMINVGGNKVYPVEIENVVRSVPGVADARAYGEASSILGELVKCDLVIEEGHVADDVEAAVRARTLSELSPVQRPRFISIVSSIPRTAAGKIDRGK